MVAAFSRALGLPILGAPMSISPLNGHDQLRAARAFAVMRGNSPSAPPSAAVRQSDSIELSDAARSLASARNTVIDAPEVRAERVAEIKAALVDGTYSVDSRALARSLIKARAV
jgi:negative regulator of flagellin synthesis FlgM